MPDRMSENMSYRMPGRMTTASVLEYMSKRKPEAKVVPNRMSADCTRTSHAINVQFEV